MADSLYRDVYLQLRNTTSRLKDELRKKLEEFGITWPQFHALYHIGKEGIPSNELARELHCNASNMTGLIDRMTENGWVYREHSAEDRRIWYVKLTKEGARLKAVMLPQHKENIEQRMGVLNDQELITLRTLLTKLMDGPGGNNRERD
jgi:MarR family 2-MHQ and catechol resistance regulon transcriptional repressor